MDDEEEEFDYIIKHPPPSRLCFGSTRPRMPQPTGQSSTAIRRQTDSDLLSTCGSGRQLQLRCPAILSKLGYGPLASATPRFADPNAKATMPERSGSSESENPTATTATARLPPPRLSIVKAPPPPPHNQRWPPFGRSMHERLDVSTTPGPCRYMPYHQRIERVAHSFGGRRRIRPAVHTVCTPNCQVVCALWPPAAAGPVLAAAWTAAARSRAVSPLHGGHASESARRTVDGAPAARRERAEPVRPVALLCVHAPAFQYDGQAAGAGSPRTRAAVSHRELSGDVWHLVGAVGVLLDCVETNCCYLLRVRNMCIK